VAFNSTWKLLKEHLQTYYYKPDLEALRVLLCTQISHYWLYDPPVWISLNGLPGSGKTAIYLAAILNQQKPDIKPVSSLTVNSFLSGFGPGHGILPQLKKKHGILVFPDLSTSLLSIDPKESKQIMGQMRRVYDGEFEKQVGNQKKPLTWKGKVTAIAACTPDIEEHWAIHRDMGERWLTLQLRTIQSLEDMENLAIYAAKNIGRYEFINNETMTLVSNLMTKANENSTTAENLEDHTIYQICSHLSILVESLRMNVKREFVGNSLKVVGKGNIQMPTRTPQALYSLIRASSVLRGTPQIDQHDLQIAKRLALDSIPTKRWKLLRTLIDMYPNPVQKIEVAMGSGLAKSAFDKELENLRYLELVNIVHVEQEDEGYIIDPESLKDLDPNNQYVMAKVKNRDRIGLTERFVRILKTATIL